MMISRPFDDRLSPGSITPVALSYFARSEGWAKSGTYRQYSDIYTADGKPPIIVPHIDSIDDYELVVSDLIALFSDVLDRDPISVYRDLTVADRDVVRIRVIDADPEGLPFQTGHDLFSGARRMLSAAASSIGDLGGADQGRASQQGPSYLNSVRLSHTERGSFALVIVSSVVAPRLNSSALIDENESSPRDRLVAQRLSESLTATRLATDGAVAGESDTFDNAVSSGVSANLCEAVAELVESVSSFDVTFNWAMTRPTSSSRGPVPFSFGDHSVLKEAALTLRSSEPEYGKSISGFIYRLTRNRVEIDGTVTVQASIDGYTRSVAAILNQSDYAKAIRAHSTKSIVYLDGDLERVRNRLHLRNARLVNVVEVPVLPGLDDDDLAEHDEV